MRTHNWFITLFGINVILQVADAVTTHISLLLGGTEGNVVMATVIANYGIQAFWLIKGIVGVGFLGLLAFCSYRDISHRDNKLIFYTVSAFTALMLFIIINNIIIIGQL